MNKVFILFRQFSLIGNYKLNQKTARINNNVIFAVNWTQYIANLMRLTVRNTILFLSLIFASLSFPVLADVSLFHYEYGDLSARMQVQTAGFTGSDTWFGKVQENIGNDANTWWEGTAEPSVKGLSHIADSEFYGEFSYLYGIQVAHDPSGLTTGMNDPHKGLIEQAYVGWRSGTLFGDQENLLDLSVGRQDYQLGTGFLIYDGANDGGNRGAWWVGARQSFDDTAIAKINWKSIKLELFHLNVRARNQQNELALDGVNFEYMHNTIVTVGFSYINAGNRQQKAVNNLNTYDFRLNLRPLAQLPDLEISGEYAFQENNISQSEGGYAQILYQHKVWFWMPKFIYRYTGLEGDDPKTSRNEGFNALAYGFSDWGTWYQGEITGEHVFGSSNLNSHLLRVEMAPMDNVVLNAMYYYFEFDRASALGSQVKSQHFADEINLIADWYATENTLISASFAVAIPGKGAQQFTGGNKSWTQMMLYGSYTF